MMIEVIDLSNCNLLNYDKIADDVLVSKGFELYSALSRIGFIYLKNSGISKKEIDFILNKLQEFFNLDVATKLNYLCSKDGHGYLPMEKEQINPERPGDLKETYNISGCEAFNPDGLWPDDVLPNFSTEMKTFMQKCSKLTLLICKLLGVGLKLKDKNFLYERHSKLNSSENLTALRGLYYPPLADDVVIKPNQIRLGEHSDYGSFTLLFQDPIGGLQIEQAPGNFIDVVPIEGTIVLNIGDLMQQWTVGRLKSTVHRVLIPKDEHFRKLKRRCLAYFVNPDQDTLIEPLSFQQEADPAKPDRLKEELYPAKTANEWLLSRFYAAVN